MFMIIEVDDDFSFKKKAEIDVKYPENKKWEELMWNYTSKPCLWLNQVRSGC